MRIVRFFAFAAVACTMAAPSAGAALIMHKDLS